MRDVIAATAIALACAGIAVSPALDRIHGLSLDILTALRFEMFGKRSNPETSPTVVVAIDEESYRAAPFKGSPTLTWTGEIGRVLNADRRRRRQSGRLRHGHPDLDRAVGNPLRRRHAGRKGPRLRPRFPARAGDGCRARQGGARRAAARQRPDPALARPAHRRAPAAEYPPAQHHHRRRRHRAPHAAEPSPSTAPKCRAWRWSWRRARRMRRRNSPPTDR